MDDSSEGRRPYVYRLPGTTPERRAELRRIAAEKFASGEWGLFPAGCTWPDCDCHPECDEKRDER